MSMLFMPIISSMAYPASMAALSLRKSKRPSRMT